MTPEQLQKLAEQIRKGAAGPNGTLTLADFKIVYRYEVERVEPERAAIVVALVDGRAWVTFPHLSSQLLVISQPGGVARKDFDILSPSAAHIYGGEHKTSIRFFLDDVKDAPWLPLGLALISVLFWINGLVPAMATAVLAPVTLASALFFAVFVLFGVGEVVRAAPLQRRMFETGQLQSCRGGIDIGMRIIWICRPGSARSGWVVALTNNARYWREGRDGEFSSDAAFRISEGRVLTGSPRWRQGTAAGTMKGTEALELRGSYPCAWQDYSSLGTNRGELFRYLAFEVV